MSVTRAFDLAQFVATPANVQDGVVVNSLGPPFTTQFAPLVVGSKPGVTVGASVPAANAPGQTLVSGAGPGFNWGVSASASSAVTSVAGRTGDVMLTHADITDWTATLAPYALTANIPAPYILPTASTSVLGGVKVDGSTIHISGGVISSTGGSGGGIADAPSDGNLYGRENAAWVVVPTSGGGGSSIAAGSTTTTGFAAGNLLVSDGSTVHPANGSVYPATGAYATAIQKGNATYPMYESAYIPNGGIYRSLVWNATGGLVAPGVSFVLEPGAYNSGVNLGYKGFIGWNTGSWGFGSFPDIALIADGDVGPGIISARTYSYGGGGGGPSALRAYNVYTDFNNGEWAALDWRTVPNTLVIGAQANGSGAIRNVNIVGAVVTINGNPIDALDCGTF